MIYYKRHGNANAEGTEDSLEHDEPLEFFCNADSCSGNNTHGIDYGIQKEKGEAYEQVLESNWSSKFQNLCVK